MGLVARNGHRRSRRTAPRSRHNRSLGIADVAFPCPRTAQMIRQEIVHFRTCSVIRSYDPSAAERLTELAAVVIYQRTSIFVLLTVGILMLNLCAIGKIDSRSSPSNRPRRKTLMAS